MTFAEHEDARGERMADKARETFEDVAVPFLEHYRQAEELDDHQRGVRFPDPQPSSSECF